ncbi:MAG: hypothetical protein WEA61_03650 [Anaerolineales bacterium]
MTSILYNSAKLRILQGDLDFENDEFKVALFSSAYIANQDAHEFFADLTNEVSGSGYTAGGKILQNKALIRDDDNDVVVFDAGDLSWTVATFTARAAVIYKGTGSPATSPVLAYIDFEEDLEAAGEDFLLQWHENGILTLGD